MTRPSLTLTRDRHWISPYFFSVFVALREKKLAFEIEEIALHDGAQRSPGYADASVTARVPALRHRDADARIRFVVGGGTVGSGASLYTGPFFAPDATMKKFHLVQP